MVAAAGVVNQADSSASTYPAISRHQGCIIPILCRRSSWDQGCSKHGGVGCRCWEWVWRGLSLVWKIVFCSQLPHEAPGVLSSNLMPARHSGFSHLPSH